jgi:predicted short-subunit dehydrogenase-like oxidoreductase (DUF2520 family)
MHLIEVAFILYFRAMAKITLIGAGRAATALGKALLQKGHTVLQVWSRSAEAASTLADTLHASAITDLKKITPEADIYIIAVKDDAIETIANELQVGDKIIAHTSGIKSKEALKQAGANYGIFYPFVSMTKEADIDFKNALMMIEGSNDATVTQLKSLATTISGNVRIVQEAQRQSLHLAAVFANNFTNHMYAVAEEILAGKGMSFDDLRPLIAAHTSTVLQLSPSLLQTGPAIRHDSSTIDTHLSLLQQNEEIKRLYLTLTEAIQNRHKDT